MTAERVLEFLEILESSGVDAWIDGGWGVDALLGYQSRSHDDLDLVVALEQVDRIRQVLASRGFTLSEEHLPVRFVMAHPDLRRIDFHTVTFDQGGSGAQVQPNGGTFYYPAEGFTSGTILGRRVPCISADVQVLCHMGYEPAEKDAHDVLLLQKRFGVHLPDAYSRFVHTTRSNPAPPDGAVEPAPMTCEDRLPRRR